MAVAMVCPEYVTVMAVTEWWDAQFLRREIQELCGAQVSGLSVPIRAVDKPTDIKAVAGQTLFYDPELLRRHGRLCTSPFRQQDPFPDRRLSLLHAYQRRHYTAAKAINIRNPRSIQRRLACENGGLSSDILVARPTGRSCNPTLADHHP